MTLKMGKLVVAMAALLISSVASGAPLSLWIGQTELLGLQRKIARISVSNPEVVSVKKLKAGAELRARATGVAHVEMRTTDGFVFEFDVHVTAGAEVYSVNRAEPEHAPFTLEGYKGGDAPAKTTTVRREQQAPSKLEARRETGAVRPRA